MGSDRSEGLDSVVVGIITVVTAVDAVLFTVLFKEVLALTVGLGKGVVGETVTVSTPLSVVVFVLLLGAIIEVGTVVEFTGVYQLHTPSISPNARLLHV